MEIQLSASLGIKQKLGLSQVIEFSHLMSVPDEVLNTVAGAIIYNTDSVEKALQKRKREGYPAGNGMHKVQAVFSSLPSDGSPAGRGGLIISPDLRALEGRLGTYQTRINPDVTYIGRRNEKPEIVFSDHISGSMDLLLLQIDSSLYPETAKLLYQIKRFDGWKKGKLRESYAVIGDEQREFFEDFDATKHKIFTYVDLADDLGIDPSTIYRMLSNRWVEARNTSGDQKFLYARDLLVTKNELKKYIILPKLNEVLKEEFEKGKAFSDEEISQKVLQIARRTINKYRYSSGIPNTSERNRVYKSGSTQEPFKFV